MDSDRNLRDLHDKMDSLHQRMDRFYSWASCLQVEFRNMQQKQMFIESQIDPQIKGNLHKRLDEIRDKK